MTRQCKPSEGPWEADYNTEEWEIWHETEDVRICLIDKHKNAEQTADLIAEAGTVYHETKLTPRKILAQRDELLAALKAMFDKYGGMYDEWQEADKLAHAAIANAEKGE